MYRERVDNPRFPHTVTIKRLDVSDNPFQEEEDEDYVPEETKILYTGPGRVFTDTTTTGNDDMSLNRRKCSIPVRFDKWKYEVLDGDTIEVKVGNIEYSGVIRDVEPDNDRTLVYWERPRVND